MYKTSKIKRFKDIFLYLAMTEVAKQLGINYTRFRALAKNPSRLRYEESSAIAKYSMPLFQ
jgi:hypothetical protein